MRLALEIAVFVGYFAVPMLVVFVSAAIGDAVRV